MTTPRAAQASTAAPIIYVDIDDTLVRHVGAKMIPIPKTVAWVRTQADKGAQLYAWSQGGGDYAARCVQTLGLDDCFVACLPKPSYAVDDRLPTQWPGCQWIHPMNLKPTDQGQQ